MLLAATILVFILMIIRCLEKAMGLKNSSFNALRKASLSKVNTNVTEEGQLLDNFIEKAKDAVVNGRQDIIEDVEIHPYQISLDFPCPVDDRVKLVEKFWKLDKSSAYGAIEGALCGLTRFLYTKEERTTFFDVFMKRGALFNLRRCIQLLFTVPICLALLLSANSYRSGEDGRTTERLFDVTLILEVVYCLTSLFFRYKFSGRILQHNLIGLLARNRWHSKLTRVAGWLRCKDLLVAKYTPHMEPIYSCVDITDLVREHVREVWRYISDHDTYRRFNERRGDWTLAMYGGLPQLGWSTRRPFDESIILWHLATDLCFHHPDVAHIHPPGDVKHCPAHQCKVMSNYMMHLLVANPEMLLPGSRKILFTMAYKELEDIISGEETPLDEGKIAQKVIEKCKAGSITSPFIQDAWKLAEILLGHVGDKATMWEVIQGVWVEMLCFSAGRCRGYLHAEALGMGVEYLSYVWVLLTLSGMETFPEKLQSRENQSFGSHELPVADKSRV